MRIKEYRDQDIKVCHFELNTKDLYVFDGKAT